MAATDQHYRSQKMLDIVFGVSCGAMLLTTLWMFAQDYSRDYKAVQRKFRDVEATIAERDMVARLPDLAEVDDARKALAEARRELADAQARLAPEDRRLKAQREKQDTTARGIKADLDANASYLDIANDKGDAKERERLAGVVEKIKERLASAKADLDATDNEIKEKIRAELAPLEAALAKRDEEMKKLSAQFDRYAKLASQKAWGIGDTIRSAPILDGFASPIKINQIVLNDLTIDYGGFRDVPRYDRCTTCHLGIDKAGFDKGTLASLGDAEQSKRLTTKLHDAQKMLQKRRDSGENLGYDPDWMGGERAAPLGFITLLLLASAVVGAGTLGLLERSWRIGINTLLAGVGITLLTAFFIAVFSPLVPKVKDLPLSEGEITQYCAHPRMDLYVDSNSPHPMEKFGCTTCHSGQGSSTDFINAVHSPNDAVQEHEWKKQHGWASIHFWDFPMLSRRFTESSCLKCHHQVTDLIRDGSKEEAPKLLRGFNTIKDMGCFGCHEIQGVKGGRWVGPDLRLEPSPALETLSHADQEKAKSDPANPPGNLRKVGPSLRRLAEKTDEEWTRQWILSPRGFREDTKMPHFYGLTNNHPDALPDDQKRFPAAEIHSITHYLIHESKAALKGTDSYRRSLVEGARGVGGLQAKLAQSGLPDKEMKELFDISRRFADLALLNSPLSGSRINDLAARQRQLQERLRELPKADELLASMVNPAAKPGAAGMALPALLTGGGTIHIVEYLKEGVKREDADKALAPLIPTYSDLSGVTAALAEYAKPTPLGAMAGKVVDHEGNALALPDKDGDPVAGRKLFTERGCLACHAHEGTTKTLRDDGTGKPLPFVRSEANFGPELSRLREKLKPVAEKTTARQWLAQWIVNPMVHHPRTKMPVTHLTAAQANDVAAFLLGPVEGKEEWKGADPKDPQIAPPTLKELKNLARVYLAKAPGMTAKELDAVLPAKGAGDDLKDVGYASVDNLPRDSDERLLARGTVTADVLKTYIGKKAIGRLGCYACHDIGGFETAKPIGVGLNDWGKKEGDRLAFENSKAFVKKHFNHVPRRVSRAEAQNRIDALAALEKRSEAEAAQLERLKAQVAAQARIHELEHKEHDGKLTAAEKEELHKLHPQKFYESDGKKPPMEEIFYEALKHHSREGFLHLKLAEPRSYDYERDRPWDDRLRMPQFQFARKRSIAKLARESDEDFAKRKKLAQAQAEVEEAEAREAVMTFILGLVAEPVPLKYVNAPKPERAAEVAGRQVLDKYNCASCHQIQPGQYKFDLTADLRRALEEKVESKNFRDKQAQDIRFPSHSAWASPLPASDRPTAYGFRYTEYEPGQTAKVKVDPRTDNVYLTEALRFTGRDRQPREIPAGEILSLPKGSYHETPAYGGTWTDQMVPYLIKRNEDASNDNDKARSVLPPPLLREGERVQPDWLYRFLLNPGPVRPEEHMKLRMPKFNMSQEEARALVNYFTASAKRTNPSAGITAPFVSIPQREPAFWAHASGEFKSRLEATKTGPHAAAAKAQLEVPKDAKEGQKDPYSRAAFALLTNKELCVKCHHIGGKVRAEKPQGPNLLMASDRLRPEWTEHWIANPPRMFAYTPIMPQNFKNAPDASKMEHQPLFVGPAAAQTRAVRDLLMDKDRLSALMEGYTPPPPDKKDDKKEKEK
ncbi:MAG: c-type cytochrome [Gemmataceae bacterium]|nr:c-type cytochrome [Gemmataceae bacterium]